MMAPTSRAQHNAPRPAIRPAHQGNEGDDDLRPLHSSLSESCTEKTAARELLETEEVAVTTLHSGAWKLTRKMTSSAPVRLADVKRVTEEPSVGSSARVSVMVVATNHSDR